MGNESKLDTTKVVGSNREQVNTEQWTPKFSNAKAPIQKPTTESVIFAESLPMEINYLR